MRFISKIPAVVLTAGGLALISFFAFACSSPTEDQAGDQEPKRTATQEASAPEIPDVSGTWKGEAEEGGTVTLELNQEGARLSGSSLVLVKEQPNTGGTYTYRWEDGSGSVSPEGNIVLMGPAVETTRPSESTAVEGTEELDFEGDLLNPSTMDGFFYMGGSFNVELTKQTG